MKARTYKYIVNNCKGIEAGHMRMDSPFTIQPSHLVELLENFAATHHTREIEVKEITKIFGEMVGKAIGQALTGQAPQYKKTVDEFKAAITELLNEKE